ncbi:flagellar biosynthesis anti-sigma factor FlgM [Hydrogenophaga soli]
MKLDLMSEIQTGTPPAGATKPAERPAPSGATGAGRSTSRSNSASSTATGVTVTLSAQTQSLSAPGTSEVVDTGKVEAMRSAIQSGSFKVNAEAIADKLLSNAKEMLTAARR